MAWSLFWPQATGLSAPNTHHGEKKPTGRVPWLESQALALGHSANQAVSFGTCSCLMSSHQREPRRSHWSVIRGPPGNSSVHLGLVQERGCHADDWPTPTISRSSLQGHPSLPVPGFIPGSQNPAQALHPSWERKKETPQRALLVFLPSAPREQTAYDPTHALTLANLKVLSHSYPRPAAALSGLSFALCSRAR